eukprot:TRINITY_DN9616_c0_g1_i1.p1 TRINITY_DN9616_c0_g1~~TRINITY_DN9616_c0_g1_i1.p1  ORF type:complete len:507 (+),score=74.56 TRINITY_DN9616_c0_g1_i1:58-1578(+)
MASAKGVVVLVDPLSTGYYFAEEVKSRGYDVIVAWGEETSAELRTHVPRDAKKVTFLGEIEPLPTVKATAEAAKKIAGDSEILACIVGCETGIGLADALSEELGVASNGTSVVNRRNKSVQQRLVKAQGIRAVREAVGSTWADVERFAETEPMPVIVKPVESAGSDGVMLCQTLADTRSHFELLLNSQRRVGSQNASVLVQEFLKGDEYVVDHVSRDGVHKTVMIWKYDKRPMNGAPFVYFGMVPISAHTDIGKQLVKYMRQVLDAIGIRHGPTHGEVMMTADGPCLVETNCRAHGGDGVFLPLAKALTGGYTQVSAGVDCYLDKAAFERLPDVMPTPFKASGQQIDLVSTQEGVVIAMPGIEEIKRLPSLIHIDCAAEIGGRVTRTVDMFTMPGSLLLVSDTEAQLEKDIQIIRNLEATGRLFDIEDHGVLLNRPRAPSEMSMLGELLLTTGRSRTVSEATAPWTQAVQTGNVQSSASKATGSVPLIAVVFCTGIALGLMLGRRS